jgi:hypothetical protein
MGFAAGCQHCLMRQVFGALSMCVAAPISGPVGMSSWCDVPHRSQLLSRDGCSGQCLLADGAAMQQARLVVAGVGHNVSSQPLACSSATMVIQRMWRQCCVEVVHAVYPWRSRGGV